MKEGENLADQARPSQHFAKPPALPEASLVKELEKRGIGRPIYAVIISTIQERGYVTTHNRRFMRRRWATSSPIGSTSFANPMDYGFTAGMESIDDGPRASATGSTCSTVLRRFQEKSR